MVVGTFRGGDVMAMIHADPARNIVVVDSFHGLAEPGPKDEGTRYKTGEFDSGGLLTWLQNFRTAGIVPPREVYPLWITAASLRVIAPRPVALVWLDVDFHEPTLAAIQHFAPMLVKGGMMITHDFNLVECPGVNRAIEDSGLPFRKIDDFNMAVYVQD